MSKKPDQKPEMGILGLLLVVALLGGVAAFLADYKKVAYGNLGALIWITITLLAFGFGLFYFAQYVLPQPGNEGWSEGLRLLGNFYLSAGQRYLSGSPKKNRPRPKRVRRQSGDKKEQRREKTAVFPSSFTQVKAGLLHGHQIIAVSKGSQFVRPVGPGFVRLYRGEYPDQLLDLRPQMRSQIVKATSHDGIALETTVSVTFRIRQETGHNPLDPLVHPFDPATIFHVSGYTSKDANGAPLIWTQQLLPQAASELSNQLSTAQVDELNTLATKNDIKQRITRTMSRIAESHGLELINIGIGPILVPKRIIDQRIKTWQANWQRKIDIKHAQGDAAVTRRMKQARARAQIEIIEKITEGIDAMQQYGDVDLTEIITLRMIEALEEASSSLSVQPLIPQQVVANLVMDASNQMQSWMGRQANEKEER